MNTPPLSPLLELPPADAPVPLPHAPMLTYVTASNSAPRVRAVTTWGVRSVALLEILLGFWFNRAFIVRLVAIATVHTPAALTNFSVALSHSLVTLVLAVIMFAVALFQWLLAASAGRGKRSSCFLLIGTLIPFELLLICLAAGTGASAIDTFDHFQQPFALLGLGATAAAALAFLFTKDLATFLRWAALNPYTEKPSTAFLSLRPDTSLLQPAPARAPDPSLGLPAEPPPTRVRNDTATAFACLSWLALAIALITACWLLSQATVFVPEWSWLISASRNQLLDISLILLQRAPIGIFLLVVAPLVALFSRILVSPIRQGNAAACIIAILFLLPPLALPLLTGALFSASIIASAFGLDGTHARHTDILYLLLLFPLILWSTLLASLVSNLLWIARHPHAEKPPTRFFHLRRI